MPEAAEVVAERLLDPALAAEALGRTLALAAPLAQAYRSVEDDRATLRG